MLQIVYHMYYTLYTRFNDDTHDTENPKRPAASPSGPFSVFSTRSYHAMPNRIKRLETTNAEDTIAVKSFCQKDGNISTLLADWRSWVHHHHPEVLPQVAAEPGLRPRRLLQILLRLQ